MVKEMVEKDRENLLEKIKKLFAKGNDTRGNENESQAAILLAQKLMMKNGISHSDILEGETFSNDVQDDSITGYKSLEFWHGSLGVIIAENFRCFCYINQRRQDYRNILKSINFVGLTEDIKIAKEVFYYAIMMIEYHSEVYVRNYRIDNPNTNRFKPIENSYINGYLSGLNKKFQDQKVQNKQEWGLVLVRDSSIDDYIDKELKLKKSNSKIKGSRDATHYNEGFEQGKKFNILAGEIES